MKIILNKTQMNKKELVNGFKSAGIEVEENKPAAYTDIDKQFDEKLNELKQDQDFINDGETKIHEFGYRRKSIDGIVETITDFGNIKKFILGISLDVKKLPRYDFYVDCDENGEYQTDIREVKDGEFIKLKDVLSIFRK